MPITQVLKVPVGGGGNGNSPCGGNSYGGFLYFTNGTNYFPSGSSTTCVASLTANGTDVANADYDMQWVTGIKKGCMTDLGSTMKTFACTANKNYTFKVYFLTGHVPADGTDIQITVTF